MADAVSGVATVTAAYGVTGVGPLGTVPLSSGAGTCAGVAHNYFSAPQTAPPIGGSAPRVGFVDIIATDNAGNGPSHSNAAQAGDVGADVQPPRDPVPTGVRGAANSGSIRLNWAAVADGGGSGVSGYQIRVCRAGTNCTFAAQYPVPVVTTSPTALFALTPGTTYDFYLVSADSAGNNGNPVQISVTAP